MAKVGTMASRTAVRTATRVGIIALSSKAHADRRRRAWD
jgi:hypothetical protein